MVLRLYGVGLACLFALLAIFGQAQAQSLPVSMGEESTQTEALLNEPLTREAVTELMSGLTDAQIRNILLERLSKEAEARSSIMAEEEAFLDMIQRLASATVSSFWKPIDRMTLYPEAFSRFYQEMSKGQAGYGLTFFTSAILSIGAGFLAVAIVSLFIRKWRRKNNMVKTEDLYGKIRTLCVRAFLDATLVAAFSLASIGFSESWHGDAEGRITLRLILEATTGMAIAYLAGRFVLAPFRSELRLLSCPDQTAKFLFFALLTVAFVSIFGGALLEWTYIMGARPGELLVGFWIQALKSILMAYAVWHARDGIAEMIIGEDENPSKPLVSFARAWPIFLVMAILLVWMAVEAFVANGYLSLLPKAADSDTLILLVMIPAFEMMIRAFAKHYFPDIQETETDRPGTAEARKVTRKILVRFARVTLAAIFIIAVPGIWGLDLLEAHTETGATGFIYHIIDVWLTVLMAYAMIQAFDLYYERQMAFENGNKPEEDEEELGGEGGSGGGTRLSTVLPIIRWAVLTVIAMVTIFSSLQQLGISVAPILAGAGILSLAIGFGAQTLVKDIVSGVFFLIDDAFRMGEYIEIEGTIGTVEKISARSLRLRHHKGAVHTIPYGEIPKLTNYSRDWVIMKLRFRVPFDTDMNKVKKIFKKIGAELMTHPVIGEDFIQPFKSQGVIELDDSGMVVRGKFMTKPGKQFMARKEIFNRVQAAFAENGIQFARREVLVHIPGGDDDNDGPPQLTEDQKKAIAAAAQNTIANADQADGAAQSDRS